MFVSRKKRSIVYFLSSISDIFKGKIESFSKVPALNDG